ncbi:MULTISPECIES: beta-ketoacyl-[acyl-carrier-protein] synthase family protein [unclassified Rhizobium]|jgi:nodulation protein E|uniref:beta-ketoacyl-[acyl-carrier-protein] synthase family protein n=1 Tax=unclassified Rhizobium TaxID=2613769 RepID=UPI0006468B72|nr:MULTISPECIES: beta-ketoacyl-[acyl-carrier-protein] synthase family protein [unclassified Rhizobium]MBN8952484.1 beta-ketoacyl-[acyl-carrier-protein] synthase family protein [Rhizobium tropici]OJY78962.1 MAG: beta-ACP synthase [Rhizobium sp. 60-20]RKD67685.1 3-oxoacyl-[acyl-carrier-protein] synthase II [Rhizobium sp. WW_1]
MRRVAITGMGVVAGTGNGLDPFWQAVKSGRHCFSPLEGFDETRLNIRHGAIVRDFQPNEQINRKKLGYLDRFAQLALVAAQEAIGDAKIEWTETLKRNTGVVTGSTIGGQATQDDSFLRLYGSAGRLVNPVTIPKVMPCAATVAISMEFGLTGPSYTLSTACASSAHAIGQAFWMVRQGTLDLAIAGGSEAPFSFGYLKAWDALQVVDPEPCRPFSEDRQGLNLGEGGAMLVLEPLDAAIARGAKIYAEIVGFGMTADAHHLTQPHLDGPVRAMQSALKDAGLEPAVVDYINAHGTGTPTNDAMECRAIRAVFDRGADRIAVSSTKGVHGHTLGAAGALEAIATALAIKNETIPPTANFTVRDPECDLDIVPNTARSQPIRAALSNSFAFGGLNAVLAFSRHDA